MSAKGDKRAILCGGTGATTLAGQVYYGPMKWVLGAHFFSLPGMGLLHPRLFQRKFREQVETVIATMEALLLLLGHSQAALKIIELAIRAVLRGGHKRVIAVSLAGPHDGTPLAKLAVGVTRIWPLNLVLGGITEMKVGSRQNERLRAMLQDLVVQAATDPSIELPYIVFVAAAHDHLVPLASSWPIIEGYPRDRVFYILLLGGNGPPPKNLPEGDIIVRTQWGLDDHVSMVFSPALLRLLVKIYNLKIDESLEEALIAAA